MAGYTDAWGTALLRRIGAPVTPENLKLLHAWARAEGGTAKNNPLNTTQAAPGATPYNRNNPPVRNYPTPAVGLTATAQTLTNGHYQPILDSLRAGKPATETAAAIARTPWGTGTGVQRVLGVSPGPSAPSGAVASTPSNAPRTGLQAASWALAQVGKPHPRNQCLGFVANAYGLQGSGLPAGKHDNAAGFWAQATNRHGPDARPPAGALVFYSGKTGSPGHVAVSVGGGKIVSTDLPTSGRVGLVDIKAPVTKWGMHYLGWTAGQFPAGKGQPTGGTGGAAGPIPGAGTVVPVNLSTGAGDTTASGSDPGILPFPNPLDWIIGKGTDAATGVAQGVANTVFRFVLYWGMAAGGATLMLVGLVLLALSTRAGKDAAKLGIMAAAPEAAPEIEGAGAAEGAAAGSSDGITAGQARQLAQARADRDQQHRARMREQALADRHAHNEDKLAARQEAEHRARQDRFDWTLWDPDNGRGTGAHKPARTAGESLPAGALPF